METLITNRREFLYQMGKLGLAASSLPLAGCFDKGGSDAAGAGAGSAAKLGKKPNPYGIPYILPSTKDDLVLADGVLQKIIIKEGQKFGAGAGTGNPFVFGSDNDYIMTVPYKNQRDALMWVNHEQPSFTKMYGTKIENRGKKEIAQERRLVGGSIVRIQKQKTWGALLNDKANKRLDGETKIKFAADVEVAGSKFAEGTIANCSGGITPWKTILTCEENSNSFYGTSPRDKYHRNSTSALGWEEYFKNPPEHYGWVVEVNPFTGDAKKLTSLGRFAHECAMVSTTKDGRAVVYTTDDRPNECLYKFVASKPNSLETGTLYVADTKNGKWISLNRDDHPALKKEFKTQLEIQTHTRVAAELAGGTPLDRPEDVEIDPETGAVIIAMTKNPKADRPYGSLLRIMESGDRDSMEFEAKTLVSGGLESGFACPDNLTFDRAGNLWVATDISGGSIGNGKYASFGHNGLFVIPMKGGQAGEAVQIASAPVQAEMTGITPSPDGKSLFVSVQHPGVDSFKKGYYTSHWPDGGTSVPHSAVVELHGPTIEKIMSGGYLKRQG